MMGGSEVTLALAVYALFSLLSAVGAFVIADRSRGRVAGVLAAVVTLAFFAALLAGLRLLLAEELAGLSG